MPNITPDYLFKFLFETNDNLLARTYRTTLKEKFEDTLFLLFGNGQYMGLFDYATLGIPRAIFIGLTELNAGLPYNIAIEALINIIPKALIYFLPKAIFSAIGVLIAAPFVLFVHLFSSILSQKTKNEAFKVKIQPCESTETVIASIFRSHNNSLQGALHQGTPVQISSQIQTLDDELKSNDYATLENYTTEEPTITHFNDQYLFSILLLKNHNPFAVIPIASPYAAYRVTQLAKINFAHIGEHLEHNNEFKTHISEMQQGLVPWNTEATRHGYLCIFLLLLNISTSRTKPTHFDIAHHIATYLIPDSIKVANKETGFRYSRTHASFFLMNRASEIIQDVVDARNAIALT